MIPLAGPLFFSLWRRVVRNAGGASAIPLVWRLVPERWRGKAQAKVDEKIGKVGK